jgi:ubiquinone/menaquinone biosynthesis C-methylase UbiE
VNEQPNAEFWERKYSSGHAQRYPWDFVVTFVFRNAAKDKPRGEVRILEVGCGTASNLWFAAREGFAVAGIDGSKSAIEAAQKRFAQGALTGDLRVGDFTALPFADNSFDLAIDRGAITCAPLAAGRKAVAEIARTLKRGGKFLFNPYSIAHSSAQGGRIDADGAVSDITSGSLTDSGRVYFYSRREAEDVLGQGLRLLKIEHLQLTDETAPQRLVHAEWRIVAEKP